MLPDVTKRESTPDERRHLNAVFEEYITFCALGGIITDDDGATKRMSVGDFCDIYQVTRMTLNRWKRNTPDWSVRVDARRNEIMPIARTTAVWNNMYLIARQSKEKAAAVAAARLFLGHNGLQLPIQRQDIKIQGGLADLLSAAATDGILEGEIVEPEPIDEGTSGQTAGVLPHTS